ncbi:MAG: thioredoxin domain-containing protein [Solirubrobacteraceae bacterium]|jgi:uncharacterized protein YyaL (SSP411 family)
MPNALARETSPYLRQHADNPVDWMPWGTDALRRAAELQRPLFVSIGYAACHWCHVMERESFQDDATAALMNERFVCVKVDREERPDIDGIYMEAVQLLTGHGGWPLNVFLTPDQTPFFGGTYWPPQPRNGIPSFTQILDGVATIWAERRAEAVDFGARLADGLRAGLAREPATGAQIGARELADAVAALRRTYDPAHGGFGGAPKFPPHCALELLLAQGEREMSIETLRAMARGGICDQVGGGFARYAVDERWTVPHFEKMLYDNALLARSYLHGWQRSGEQLLLRTCRETLDFALRELRGEDGGFCSSLDADAAGVEGSFYVWQLAELRDVLGEHAAAAIAYFGATEDGNFEGANVLTARGPEPPARAEIRAMLLAARDERVRPGLDDKRLAAWNALMIDTLAQAGGALEDDGYLAAAIAAAEFVWGRMRDEEGRLLRSYNHGQARLGGYLEDHAYLLEALLHLYEATFDERFYDWACTIADTLLERFADHETEGFFVSASDAEPLIARRKDSADQPIPAGSSSAALGLLRLAALSGERRYEDAALGTLRLASASAVRFPATFAYLLCAADFNAATVREVALVGEHRTALERVVRRAFRPHLVLAGMSGATATRVPLLAGRTPVDGRAVAYVCERFSCQAPVSDADALAALLED